MLTLSIGMARAEVPTQTFEGVRYRVHRIDPAAGKLQLVLQNELGQPYNTFKRLERSLNAKGQQLKFAMNAGIYEPGFVPTGLHIENGQQLVELNRDPPPRTNPTPNFWLKPNGVFFIDSRGAAVMETERYAESGRTPTLATQSGPLLLQSGQIHPALNADGPSRLLRNGVGIDREGQAVFVATERTEQGRINLHRFARLFLSLGCQSALYLDGDISEIFVRGEDAEIQATTSFAAMFVVIEEKSE